NYTTRNNMDIIEYNKSIREDIRKHCREVKESIDYGVIVKGDIIFDLPKIETFENGYVIGFDPIEEEINTFIKLDPRTINLPLDKLNNLLLPEELEFNSSISLFMTTFMFVKNLIRLGEQD